MGFQTSVNFRLTSGFLGQVIRDVPSVVKTWRLTDQVDEPNTFGRAFGYAGEVGAAINGSAPIPTAEVGGGEGAFAGILCHPESLALYGGASGPLSPSEDVPPSEVVQLMTKGEVVVAFTTAATFGDPVFRNTTDGSLAIAAGAGLVELPGAYVTNTITAAGLTTISLG